MKSKKRNPIIASFLAIIGPGLGQIYNGQIKKGITFYFVSYLLLFLLPLTGLQYRFYGLLLFVGVGILFVLYIMGDGLIVALKTKEVTLKWYNRWYFYLLFALLTIGVSSITEDFVENKILGIKTYKVSVGTMMPSLMSGDRIMVNQKHYKSNKPQRGDIVVFKYPKDPSREFIKRIVAVGGDVIKSKNKVIYVNAKPINEPYIQLSDTGNNLEQRDNFGPHFIPKGKLFVMGDNRDQSYDSRFFGFVGIEKLRGKALYIYWSKNKNRIGMQIK